MLFVCLGNICRSPTAEAVFRKRCETLMLDLSFDSAGTSSNHVGETSDPRSIRHAELRGYSMTHRARQIQNEDFDLFDLILTMDDSNFGNVMEMFEAYSKSNPGQGLSSQKIMKVTDFCQRAELDHVPDPYYGKAVDFELVIDLLEEAAEGFLQVLHKK